MRIINNNINNRFQQQNVQNIDNMTYEQIIDLSDKIGIVSKGMVQKEIDVTIIFYVQNSEFH